MSENNNENDSSQTNNQNNQSTSQTTNNNQINFPKVEIERLGSEQKNDKQSITKK